MALVRLALKNLQLNNVQKHRWCSQLVRRFSTESADKQQVVDAGKSEKQQVAVSDSGKKSKLFPRRRRRANLWRRNNPDFAPALFGTACTNL